MLVELVGLMGFVGFVGLEGLVADVHNPVDVTRYVPRMGRGWGFICVTR
jgi:hypothetical protein